MTVDIRTVSGVDQVSFRGPGTLKISQGEQESLKIHAPTYVMEHINVSQVGSKLMLGYQAPQVVRLSVYDEVISFDLVVKDLRRLTMRGSGKVLVPDLDTDSLYLKVSGSGAAHLQHLTADSLTVKATGSGQLSIAGDIELQTVELAGSGHYGAHHLVSDVTHVSVSGSGEAHVSVSDQLDVVISGSGNVTYAGFPDVNKRIHGSGTLLRRRKEKRTVSRGEENG